MIEWCSLHEMAIASAEPKLAPAFTTWVDRSRTVGRIGGPSNTGPVCVMPSPERRVGRGAHHILGSNMMCALGVPGNMIHGSPSAGCAESPDDATVAPGM